MSFGICKFSTNLVQVRFCSFSRLDLTSKWMKWYLFEIWPKNSFELLFHCFANRIAVLWPLFLFCLNLFHHFSKVHSTGGTMSANVDLSYERCSVMLSKNSMHPFLLQEKQCCRSPGTSLPLSNKNTLWIGTVTHRACDLGGGDPILDIWTIHDHIPCSNKGLIGA